MPERTFKDQAGARRKKPGDRMDARGLEAFFKAHRGHYRRDPLGQHGLPRTRRTYHKHVVSSCHGDFHCALCMELSANIPEVLATRLRRLGRLALLDAKRLRG